MIMTKLEFMDFVDVTIAQREERRKSKYEEHERLKYDKEKINRLLAQKLYVGLTVPGFPKMTKLLEYKMELAQLCISVSSFTDKLELRWLAQPKLMNFDDDESFDPSHSSTQTVWVDGRGHRMDAVSWARQGRVTVEKVAQAS